MKYLLSPNHSFTSHKMAQYIKHREEDKKQVANPLRIIDLSYY